MASAHDWFYWALLSAVFAALTAIFAKLGLAGIDLGFCHAGGHGGDSGRLDRVCVGDGEMGRTRSRSRARPGSFWCCLVWPRGRRGLCYFRALQMGDASRWPRWTS